MKDYFVLNEVLNILKKSIIKEKDAQTIYEKGARIAITPEIKKCFEKLKAQEAKHEKVLMRWYKKIEKKLATLKEKI